MKNRKSKIKNKNLEKLKKRLERERQKLIAELKNLQSPEELGNDVSDVDEEAEEAEIFSIKVSESGAVRNRINEIDYLINKINSGTYGWCDRCSKEISKEELEENPELILCSACQKKYKNKK